MKQVKRFVNFSPSKVIKRKRFCRRFCSLFSLDFLADDDAEITACIWLKMWGRERSSSSSSWETNLMAITRCKGLTKSCKRCVRRMGRNNNDHKWIQNHFRRLFTSLVFLSLSLLLSFSIFSLPFSLSPSLGSLSLWFRCLFFFVISDVVVVLDAAFFFSCLSSAPSIIFIPDLSLWSEWKPSDPLGYFFFMTFEFLLKRILFSYLLFWFWLTFFYFFFFLPKVVSWLEVSVTKKWTETVTRNEKRWWWSCYCVRVEVVIATQEEQEDVAGNNRSRGRERERDLTWSLKQRSVS